MSASSPALVSHAPRTDDRSEEWRSILSAYGLEMGEEEEEGAGEGGAGEGGAGAAGGAALLPLEKVPPGLLVWDHK
eukprot:6716678-Pyramimonas_sp.AAC.1